MQVFLFKGIPMMRVLHVFCNFFISLFQIKAPPCIVKKARNRIYD